MKLNKIVTDTKARSLVIEAIRLERDKARVDRESQDMTIKALQRQVQALSDQQAAQAAARNVDAERINDLVTANDNQVTLIEDQKKVIASERENAAALKRTLELSDPATEVVQLNKRISHLQDQMQEFDNVWDVLNEAALEVANDNGYCEEFDSLVDSVNEELQRKTNGYRMLTPRTKEFWVTLSIDVNIEEATDEDDAIQQAKDGLDAGSYDTSHLDSYGTSVREA